MICDRIFVGLVFFQLTTAGQLLLKQAVTRSVLMVPLVIATVWFSIVYSRTYKPLMRFIALRSVKTAQGHDAVTGRYRDSPAESDGEELGGTDEEINSAENVWASTVPPALMGDGDLRRVRYDRETSAGRYVDESKESGVRFVNPSLVAP